MTKFMFSALCAAAMVTSVSAQGGKDMLSNGIKYLDVPYVAHTLEADGPEELVINCDEVDCTTLVEYVLAETLTPKLADGDISESAFADNLQKSVTVTVNRRVHFPPALYCRLDKQWRTQRLPSRCNGRHESRHRTVVYLLHVFPSPTLQAAGQFAGERSQNEED